MQNASFIQKSWGGPQGFWLNLQKLMGFATFVGPGSRGMRSVTVLVSGMRSVRVLVAGMRSVRVLVAGMRSVRVLKTGEGESVRNVRQCNHSTHKTHHHSNKQKRQTQTI